MDKRIAVIDLGTNTFQLAVAEKSGGSFRVVFQRSTPSKIGKGGINRQIITEDAVVRAVTILRDFKDAAAAQGVGPAGLFVFATSAVRNAGNRDALLQKIRNELQIEVQVIDGDTEAELIYRGVREAVAPGSAQELIMDIGGGSVEFIIAGRDRVYWKKSFEIGGQRLLDRFVKTDPISASALRQIGDFLNRELIALSNAVHQYAPRTLIGASGTFETLAEIGYWRRHQDWPPADLIAFDISYEEFCGSRNLILSSDREERMKIPGMKELRVDMIGVGVCLADHVLNTCGIREIKASRYSLKEGVLSILAQDAPTAFPFPSYRLPGT